MVFVLYFPFCATTYLNCSFSTYCRLVIAPKIEAESESWCPLWQGRFFLASFCYPFAVCWHGGFDKRRFDLLMMKNGGNPHGKHDMQPFQLS
jgi:hypothetical protein